MININILPFPSCSYNWNFTISVLHEMSIRIHCLRDYSHKLSPRVHHPNNNNRWSVYISEFLILYSELLAYFYPSWVQIFSSVFSFQTSSPKVQKASFRSIKATDQTALWPTSWSTLDVIPISPLPDTYSLWWWYIALLCCCMYLANCPSKTTGKSNVINIHGHKYCS